jgi:hypothetical protein
LGKEIRFLPNALPIKQRVDLLDIIPAQAGVGVHGKNGFVINNNYLL